MSDQLKSIVQTSIVLAEQELLAMIGKVQQLSCVAGNFAGTIDLKFYAKVAGATTVKNRNRFVGVIVNCPCSVRSSIAVVAQRIIVIIAFVVSIVVMQKLSTAADIV